MKEKIEELIAAYEEAMSILKSGQGNSSTLFPRVSAAKAAVLREQLRIQAEALLSIASDSCFDKCQEAALVASTALAKSDQWAGT